ncbi:hypothetical protein KI387_001529, partial [Taxus chinensis]
MDSSRSSCECGRKGKTKLMMMMMMRSVSVKKWSFNSMRGGGGGCAAAISPLRRYRSLHETHTDDDNEEEIPPPQGFIAVYVGAERKRFVIKTEHINHPLFRMLLDEAEKEYGFQNLGPLTLPCEVSVFRRILWALNGHAHSCPSLLSCLEES